MNDLLFTTQDPVHYVYLHRNPTTNEILYVGSGRNERAYRSTTTGNSTVYGHRDREHAFVLRELQLKGFLPEDWVEILYKGLTKSEACVLEQKITRKLNPKFNKPAGLKQLKITPAMLNTAKELRDKGMFYHDIARELGLSTMTIHRALNGKTKNLD